MPNPFADNDSAITLTLLSDALDDMERTRIANQNRFRQLTRNEPDKDGEERGFGLPPEHPQVRQLSAVVDSLLALEHESTLMLQRAVRSHPLGPWVKRTVGVGEKQGARLIAVIRDPYWNDLYDRPRLVSELWAYCGLHVLSVPGHSASGAQPLHAGDGLQAGGTDQTGSEAQTLAVGVAPSRVRGQKANWSQDAKTRVYLVAESCMKQRTSPYRPVYEAGRLKYAESLHQVDCRRCGPSGRPALAGSVLPPAHQHARAMRLVMKEILKDLWLESRFLHGAG
jgi:hypothetical protein